MNLDTPAIAPPLPEPDPADFPAYLTPRPCTKKAIRLSHGIAVHQWSQDGRPVRWDIYQYGPRVGTYKTERGAQARINRLIADAAAT
ncbi:hypothetical protein FE633_17530 [Streptomyces montanus]|uniref:Uncharacterized protein n=1 Tax=Streptomyces montanus TaxID=2580423 RepID=A0A5R9FWT1_9ACTN|nr:hypothetical protein [Streptomyces montanus]TLS44944.1 hypothetical protein FE633_17530 [Streptomyces montanus]